MRRTIDQASTAFTMEIGIWGRKATLGEKIDTYPANSGSEANF
jgi:hypothetical protein